MGPTRLALVLLCGGTLGGCIVLPPPPPPGPPPGFSAQAPACGAMGDAHRALRIGPPGFEPRARPDCMDTRRPADSGQELPPPGGRDAPPRN